jgi:SAM-dependent methyltransferase
MARQRGIEVIRARAECIPIRDGSCSSVLLVTVICYLDDPILAFRELHRILAPQGFLIIGFIEREGIIVQKFLHEKKKHRFLSLARFYSFPEVQALLEDTRFHMITVDSWDGFCVISAHKD